MYIPIILGTARVGRQSEKVAKFVFNQVNSKNIDSEIIDVRNYRINATKNPSSSPLARKLAQKIIPADALIIVSPEYNHGYPGELKMMLDLLYEEYFNKPVAFCGVSASALGGARVVEQLRLVSIEFHMIPIRDALYFSNVESIFDNQGRLQDQSYITKISSLLEKLKLAIKK